MYTVTKACLQNDTCTYREKPHLTETTSACRFIWTFFLSLKWSIGFRMFADYWNDVLYSLKNIEYVNVSSKNWHKIPTICWLRSRCRLTIEELVMSKGETRPSPTLIESFLPLLFTFVFDHAFLHTHVLRPLSLSLRLMP